MNLIKKLKKIKIPKERKKERKCETTRTKNESNKKKLVKKEKFRKEERKKERKIYKNESNRDGVRIKTTKIHLRYKIR